MRTLGPELLHELAALLKERVGLHIRRDSVPALRLAVAARFDELAPAVPDGAAYVALLHSPEGDEELRRLLPLVTVGKTSFFRDERQFAALGALMPGLLARPRDGGRPAAFWSAGCATGEEPYSIAMTAAEAGAAPGHVEILATDVNPEAVAAAARGEFDSRRVRDVPGDVLARHFDRDGERYHVRASLRRLITAIRPHNLVASAFPRPVSGGWDVVFCRNVIIYFDTPTTQQVLERFHDVLAPGGYLFLGYSESLFRLFEGFELTEIAGAFVYRRPEATTRAFLPTPLPLRPTPPAGTLPPGMASPGANGVTRPAPAGPRMVAPAGTADAPVRSLSIDGGRGGSARPAVTPVHHLVPPGAPPTTGSPPLAPQEFLDGAIALVREGRFGAARELLERLLERGGEDLAVRLTLANLYGVLRQPDRARECYVAALALEPLSAEAHLFYGIHLLAVADVEGAGQELSRALFLDPDLALAHYYLGRCREAQRDAQRARLCYRNAIEAFRRLPAGSRQAFLGHYPDLPEDASTFARAAAYALAAL